MNIPDASINPVDATFVLAVLVLAAGVVLSAMALKAPTTNEKGSQQVFAAVGVLFGLLAAGGIGTLFAQQNAETAEKAAVTAGEEAATQVSEQVPGQVEEALEASPAGGSGNKSGGSGTGKTP